MFLSPTGALPNDITMNGNVDGRPGESETAFAKFANTADSFAKFNF